MILLPSLNDTTRGAFFTRLPKAPAHSEQTKRPNSGTLKSTVTPMGSTTEEQPKADLPRVLAQYLWLRAKRRAYEAPTPRLQKQNGAFRHI